MNKCECAITFGHRGRASVCYLGERLGAGVQFASVDVKLGPFVPEPPGVQQVAVVLDPALHAGVLQHVARRPLLEESAVKSPFLHMNAQHCGPVEHSNGLLQSDASVWLPHLALLYL